VAVSSNADGDFKTSLIIIDHRDEPTLALTSKELLRSDTRTLVPISDSIVIIGSGSKPKDKKDEYVL
jgi:hypothetical protein